jgi:hypothetical protein
VITLVDYRDGKLFRYVVMEKRTGWGAEYSLEKRNGEWEFQAFNADKSVNLNENLDRCFSCHKSQAQQDFVYTRDRMTSATTAMTHIAIQEAVNGKNVDWLEKVSDEQYRK